MPTSFAVHVAALQASAYAQGTAAVLPGVLPTAWSLPPNIPSGVPLYAPVAFKTACDRADLNAACLVAYTTGGDVNAGRVGQVAANKMAIDHMAGRERGLHARHATPVRLRAWRAARLLGHASNAGVFGAFAAAVDDVFAAATAAPNGQSRS